MSKPRKHKEYKPKPAIKGVMACEFQHRWDVVDLNPEAVSRPCPVCGTMTSIEKGIQYD